MKLMRVVAAAAAVFFSSSYAGAGTVGAAPSLALEVTSSVGHDVLNLTPTLTANGDGSYSFVGGDTLSSFSILFDLKLNPDPKLAGSFTLQNLSGTTQTFTVAATLSGLASIGAPTSMSGFYGEATYTDLNDSGVTLASALFYQPLIDGNPVLGNPLKGLGSFSLTASAGTSGTTSQESFGPETGPGVGSSIGVRFPGFSLTAGDQVEVPFEFAVVPEPGFASLFVVMAGTFLARAARKSAR
jgi:hypothetical protein